MVLPDLGPHHGHPRPYPQLQVQILQRIALRAGYLKEHPEHDLVTLSRRRSTGMCPVHRGRDLQYSKFALKPLVSTAKFEY